jgi:hypothetical protein
MKVQSKRLGARDQGVTAFSAILLRLCEASGAYAAALVDAEGETVDYAGRIAPFDIRVAAAELRIALACFESTRLCGDAADELILRSEKHSFLVWSLSDGYAITLVLGRRAFGVSRRALAEAAWGLEVEAGLTKKAGSKDRLRWLGVDVMTEPDDPRRPRAVWHEGAWMPIEILGRYQSADLGHGEVGYMTRFTSGAERLLVREPLGQWFAGEPS